MTDQKRVVEASTILRLAAYDYAQACTHDSEQLAEALDALQRAAISYAAELLGFAGDESIQEILK